jgi:uncharacterized protein with HEPN domain
MLLGPPTPPYGTCCVIFSSRSSSPPALTGSRSKPICVTRCLEIISEASRRLPDDLKARHPSIAWREMAGAGNLYRHDYEDVAAQYVWGTVRRALPPLRAVRFSGAADARHNNKRAAQVRIALIAACARRRPRILMTDALDRCPLAAVERAMLKAVGGRWAHKQAPRGGGLPRGFASAAAARYQRDVSGPQSRR